MFKFLEQVAVVGNKDDFHYGATGYIIEAREYGEDGTPWAYVVRVASVVGDIDLRMGKYQLKSLEKNTLEGYIKGFEAFADK